MRRAAGAVVVMAVIAVWNLTGQWLVRRGIPPVSPPVMRAAADSVTPPRAAIPAAPAPGRVRSALPASFHRDPLAFLSTAPAESLDMLPGVGPVLSARIIAARGARGSFQSWDDVLAIKGIGPRTVSRWQSLPDGQ